MHPLATSIAMSLDLARNQSDASRRRADEWRELHRRPDALPDPVKPLRRSWQARLGGFAMRRHRPQAEGA